MFGFGFERLDRIHVEDVTESKSPCMAIKPSTDITFQEAEAFWEDEFKKAAKEAAEANHK